MYRYYDWYLLPNDYIIIFQIKSNPIFKKMIPVEVLLYATTSSVAVLPLNIENVINGIGISEMLLILQCQ